MEMDYLNILETSYQFEIIALIFVGVVLIATILILTLIKKAKDK